jgi:hypothetical protein
MFQINEEREKGNEEGRGERGRKRVENIWYCVAVY